MSKAMDVVKDRAKSIKQRFFGRPHHKAMAWTLLILVVTGVLSIVIYHQCPAASAILASISAGCITGIVFYVISNIRNNEIHATIEEYKSVAKYYNLAYETESLCSRVIEKRIGNMPDYQADVDQLIDNTNNLITFMATKGFDLPKATKKIGDFPSNYLEKIKAVRLAMATLENHREELEKDQAIEHLCKLLMFYTDTKSILSEPWIQLMMDVDYYEKTIT